MTSSDAPAHQEAHENPYFSNTRFYQTYPSICPTLGGKNDCNNRL